MLEALRLEDPRTPMVFASTNKVYAPERSDALSRVLRDKDLAQDLIAAGLQAIRTHHAGVPRVRQLLSIVAQRGSGTPAKADAASAAEPAFFASSRVYSYWPANVSCVEVVA